MLPTQPSTETEQVEQIFHVAKPNKEIISGDPTVSQVTHLAAEHQIDLLEDSTVKLYKLLREQTTPLSDQEIFAEVLLREGRVEEYEKVASYYPNIFEEKIPNKNDATHLNEFLDTRSDVRDSTESLTTLAPEGPRPRKLMYAERPPN